MVEEGAAADEHIVRISVAADHHVGIRFGDAVGIVGMDGGVFGGCIGASDAAKDFSGGGLIDTGMRSVVADGFENADRSKSGDFSGIERMSPGVGRDGLGGDVVDFVRLVFFDDVVERFTVNQVSSFEGDLAEQVIDVFAMIGGRTAEGADDIVTFFEE